MKKIVGLILGIAGLLGMDWYTKYWSEMYLGDRSIPIIGDFLQLRYVLNTGLSFSKFAGNRAITTAVPVLGIVGFIVMYIFIKGYLIKHNGDMALKLLNLSTLLFIIGFVGNYVDRIIYSGVRDFISVKGFAVFNVADIYITGAEILWIIMAICQQWKESKEKKSKRA